MDVRTGSSIASRTEAKRFSPPSQTLWLRRGRRGFPADVDDEVHRVLMDKILPRQTELKATAERIDQVSRDLPVCGYLKRRGNNQHPLPTANAQAVRTRPSPPVIVRQAGTP
jgi:hypothetical protein